MTQSIYQALLEIVKQKRHDLNAAEIALQDHADDVVKACSPFQEGDMIADRRMQTKPFGIIESVFCPHPELIISNQGLSGRIMVRKIRADSQPSLNVQQLRNPEMYVKFKTATLIEDDEL